MGKKSKEELALMSSEELQAMVLHLQDEVDHVVNLNAKAVRLNDELNASLCKMEMRMQILMELLKSWGEE